MAPPNRLEADHDVSRFDCGRPELNDWLKERALHNKGGASRSFVVCAGRTVAGYYCLAAGAIRRDTAPKALARNMPDPIPAIIIGRLAVDRGYQGRGIGAGLLKDALARALTVSHTIGARCVLVHALDAQAAGFYGAYGFKPFAGGALTLYLSMADIAAAL